MSRYQTETLTLAAGEAVTRHRRGNYVACISSSATDPFFVALDDEPLAEFQQGLSLFSPAETEFAKVRLVNPLAVALTLTIAYGRGSLIDARLSLTAPVKIDDTIGNEYAGTSIASGDSVNPGFAFLRNPAASGVVLVVSQVTVATPDTTQNLRVGLQAFTTAGFDPVFAKSVSAAAAQAEVGSGSGVGSTVTSFFADILLSTNRPHTRTFRPAMEIPAGSAMLVETAAATPTGNCPIEFEWRER